ncbi:MAG: hypothetical protein R3B84_00560 [Zavarzinella sp.]
MRKAWLTVLFVVIAAGCGIGAEKEDNTTKVIVKVVIPKEVASFTDQTLELRLYEYNPLIADKAADLVEKIEKAKFAHTQGKETTVELVIGAKGTVTPMHAYYLTTFVLKGANRTHIGEIDGKSGLCKVIANGNPRTVQMIVRPVR